MLLRVSVRLRGAPEPAPLPPLERLVALVTHRALYVLLLVTPLIGWAALSAYGLGPNLFGLVELPAFLAKNEPLSKALFEVHEFAGLTIGALVLLHVAGALRHGRGEGAVIHRMAPRRKS
jgi:cytochrome b561